MVPNTLMKTYMQDAPLLRERVLKILEDVVVDSAADEESMISVLILDFLARNNEFLYFYLHLNQDSISIFQKYVIDKIKYAFLFPLATM